MSWVWTNKKINKKFCEIRSGRSPSLLSNGAESAFLGPLKGAFLEKCIFRAGFLLVFVQKLHSKSAHENTFSEKCICSCVGEFAGKWTFPWTKIFCTWNSNVLQSLHVTFVSNTYLWSLHPRTQISTPLKYNLVIHSLVLAPPYDFLVHNGRRSLIFC